MNKNRKRYKGKYQNISTYIKNLIQVKRVKEDAENLLYKKFFINLIRETDDKK